MSNYADPAATHEVDLGPCRCPVADPKPHVRDVAVAQNRLGYGDLAKIRQATRIGGPEAGYMQSILVGYVSWNLVLPDGSPRPLDATQVSRLDKQAIHGAKRVLGTGKTKRTEIIAMGLLEGLDDAFEEDPLPNAPGGPSPAGSSENGFHTPTTLEPTASTTS